jgi:hypothetical protein
MKQVISISLLVLFAYTQFFNGAVWVSYEINKSEIIQKFCENIDKPEMRCEGTCHMKKMMITEEEEESQPVLNILPEILLYYSASEIELFNENSVVDHSDHYINLYAFRFLSERDIPPKV